MVKLVCTLVEICTKLSRTANLSAKNKAVALKLSVIVGNFADIVAAYCIFTPHPMVLQLESAVNVADVTGKVLRKRW